MFGGLVWLEIFEHQVIIYFVNIDYTEFYMRRTARIFSIMTTRDVSHPVECTPEAIVALRIVLIVCRMALSKAICSGFA